MKHSSILKQLLEDEYAHSSDNVQNITQITGELTNAGAGNTRVVLNLSSRDLTSLYLKSSGSEDVLKNLNDAQLKQIVADAKSKTGESNLFIRFMPAKITLSQQVNAKTSDNNATVLIDAPNALISELANTNTANVKDILAKLTPLMDIKKYYLMTLNSSRCKGIASEFDAARDESNTEECNRLFNPKFLTNYPSANTLTNAKNEWDEYYSELSGPVSAADQDKASAGKPDPTEPDDNFDGSKDAMLAKLPMAKGGDILGDLTKFLFVYGATRGPVNDDAKASGLASELEKKFGPKYNKAETVRTLNSMARAFGTESGTDRIANAVMARPNWK
jgi:hypothetical protein